MHDFYPVVTTEVVSVKCENPRDCVNPHHRYQSGVMDFGSADPMLHYKATPFAEGLWQIREDREYTLKPLDVSIRGSNAQPHAVHVYWACADTPEFNDVLWRQAESARLLSQPFESRDRDSACGMAALDGADQNIRIDEFRIYQRSG